MADKTLKASIQVDMDSKGVARGVAATNRELDKLNRTARSTAMATGIMAGISTIQTAFSALSGIINAINEHVDRLDKLGRQYSREGAAAESSRMSAQFQTDAQIGRAMGPASAAMAQREEKSMRDRAARIAASTDIGAGAAAWDTFFAAIASSFTAAKDQFVANWNDPLAVNQPSVLGAMESALGVPQFYFGGMTGSDLDGGRGSAQGMPYDPNMAANNRHLQSIDRKLGGN
jgi:Holliday junction resolvasome RuvABC endonuclease subunit